eukprot:CAMPEP_0180129602 /NCGR_PEP_ID=MMETSP0986-20121125/7401_1 /TAXON_ID=697907 /ORGANISM="non described non described, Strain CCMP2293" /LENGTH=116 /DNA_ID=CAMNT_0022069277 /DNA_START=427 /DNA_END=778 /DNA_ORIENTATION=-
MRHAMHPDQMLPQPLVLVRSEVHAQLDQLFGAWNTRHVTIVPLENRAEKSALGKLEVSREGAPERLFGEGEGLAASVEGAARSDCCGLETWSPRAVKLKKVLDNEGETADDPRSRD